MYIFIPPTFFYHWHFHLWHFYHRHFYHWQFHLWHFYHRHIYHWHFCTERQKKIFWAILTEFNCNEINFLGMYIYVADFSLSSKFWKHNRFIVSNITHNAVISPSALNQKSDKHLTFHHTRKAVDTINSYPFNFSSKWLCNRRNLCLCVVFNERASCVVSLFCI